MAVSLSCLDRASLEQLLEKGAVPEEIDRLAAHIEGCAQCGETVEALLAADQTAADLRGATVQVDESSVQLLRARLGKLRPAAGAADNRDETLEADVSGPAADKPSLSQTETDDLHLGLAQQPDEIGRLAHYRILKRLGAGGMGVVYLAEDALLGRKIALKTMTPGVAANPQSRERFFREAKAAAALEHPNVVAIFQVGEDRGVPFLAMPLLKGEPLDDRLKRVGKMDAFEAARIAAEIAEGLAAAHAQGLIHRDVKPGNVWLEGERGQVKLLDFGLARVQADETHLTHSGAILGTPAYMAPEQARGEAIDSRADLFSLGCVLYAMLTGKRPFVGDTVMGILMSLGLDTPRAPHEVDDSVPRALSDFTMRLLAKSPAERPASATEAAAELRRIAQEEAQARTETMTVAKPKPAPARPPRRRRVLVGLMLAGVAAVAVGAIVIIVRDKNGNEVGKLSVPDGGSAQVINDGDKKPNETKKPDETKKSETIVAGNSPLDLLDPAQIPAAERYPWQPKELVAVIGEHRGRNWGGIFNVAYSPDGKTVFSAGDGVFLWDAETLRERGALPGNYAAFTPDGKTLACALENDEKIVLYDLTGDEPRQRAVLHGQGQSAPVFSPDGKTLAAGSFDSTVHLWDLTGTAPAERPSIDLKATKSQHFKTVWSPDGKTLAVGADGDKAVRLWDMTANPPREKIALDGYKEAVKTLAFSPDGKTLATGADHIIRLWDLSGAAPKERPMPFGSGSTGALAFAPDGKTLACVQIYGRYGALLVDLTESEPKERAFIQRYVDALAYSPDGKTLLATSDGLLRLYDVTGSEPEERLEPHGAIMPIQTLAVAPDGKRLAVLGSWDLLRFWDLDGPTPKEWAAFSGTANYSAPTRIAYADSKTVAVGGHNGAPYLLDVAGAAPHGRVVVGAAGQVRAIASTPDGKTLAGSYPDEGVVRLWDVTGLEVMERAVLKGCTDPIALAPDGKTLACCAAPAPNQNPSTIALWDLSGAEPKRSELTRGDNFPIQSLTFSQDGKSLACGSSSGGAVLWNLAAAKPIAHDMPGDYGLSLGHCAVALSPDGKSLAVAQYNAHKVILWDAVTGKKLKSWKLPGGVYSIAFAPDGRHLFLGNSNCTVYVLRLE